MDACPRCHGQLGPSHSCVEVTTHGDVARTFLDTTRPMRRWTDSEKATIRRLIGREPTFWQRVWAFIKEAW